MMFQQSWRSSHICWALLGCFSFALRSNSSQLGWGRVIVEARSSYAELHHSTFWSNSPYTAWRCVGSLSYWKTNDRHIQRKQDGMAFCCRMLLPCWLSVPWILNKSQILSPTKHPKTITPPPCFTVGLTHAEIIRSPTLRLTKTVLGTKFIKFGHIRPKDRFPPV